MWKKIKKMWQLVHYQAPQVCFEYEMADAIVFARLIDSICTNTSAMDIARYSHELQGLANIEDEKLFLSDTKTVKISTGTIKILIANLRQSNEGDRFNRPSISAIQANNRVIDKLVDALIYSYEHTK
jgi:hypothetical protein